MSDAATLIHLLVDRLAEANISVGKTRLVKLLYLMEVEYYRKNQTRLTNLDWVFLHYGPYTHELDSLLGSPDLEVVPRHLTDGRRLDQVTVSDRSRRVVKVAVELRRLAGEVVERWGGLQIELLLDYVYFETEPMMTASRGALLDFSSIPPAMATAVRKIGIDRKKLAAIRRNVSRHAKELCLEVSECEWDAETAAAAKLWDEGRTSTELGGSVRLEPESKG